MFSLHSMMFYKEVFEDVLVCFDALKIESKPIGEGKHLKITVMIVFVIHLQLCRGIWCSV